MSAQGPAGGQTWPIHTLCGASQLRSLSVPSGFVSGSCLASPKQEVIWGRLSIQRERLSFLLPGLLPPAATRSGVTRPQPAAPSSRAATLGCWAEGLLCFPVSPARQQLVRTPDGLRAALGRHRAGLLDWLVWMAQCSGPPGTSGSADGQVLAQERQAIPGEA